MYAMYVYVCMYVCTHKPNCVSCLFFFIHIGFILYVSNNIQQNHSHVRWAYVSVRNKQAGDQIDMLEHNKEASMPKLCNKTNYFLMPEIQHLAARRCLVVIDHDARDSLTLRGRRKGNDRRHTNAAGDFRCSLP